MKKIWILLNAVSVLIIAGCDDQYRYPGVFTPYIPPENPIILFQDSTTLLNMPKDDAAIIRISLARDILVLTFISSGGCRQHLYTLYADIRFMESKPVQVNIYLSHNANNDPCDAIIQTTKQFNLSPLKRSYLAQYQDHGPILLRIHEPGEDKPLEPFILYRF